VKLIESLKKRLDLYHTFLRTELSSHITEEHSQTATHCLHYLFGCSENESFGAHNFNESGCFSTHVMDCGDCNERFKIEKDLELLCSKVNDSQLIVQKWDKYFGHLIRKTLQKTVYSKWLKQLNGHNGLIITDLKMKMQYQKSREPQAEWFGKRGNSFITIILVYKTSSDSEVFIEYF
jgi:hypothetical protein